MLLTPDIIVAYTLLTFFILFAPAVITVLYCQKRYIKRRITKLASGKLKTTPKQLIKLYNTQLIGPNPTRYARQFDFSGVYVVHNTTRNRYFVGSSETVLDHAIQSFCQSDDTDMYHDYKNGDRFKVSMFAVDPSKYAGIDATRQAVIKQYNAYPHGYNLTEKG